MTNIRVSLANHFDFQNSVPINDSTRKHSDTIGKFNESQQRFEALKRKYDILLSQYNLHLIHNQRSHDEHVSSDVNSY